MNPDTGMLVELAPNQYATNGFIRLPIRLQASAKALMTWANVESTKKHRKQRKQERQNRRKGRK